MRSLGFMVLGVVVLFALVGLLPAALIVWLTGRADIAVWGFLAPAGLGLGYLGWLLWDERLFVRRQLRARWRRSRLIAEEFSEPAERPPDASVRR